MFMTRFLLALALVLQACVTETGTDTVTDPVFAGCLADTDRVYMSDTHELECMVPCRGTCADPGDRCTNVPATTQADPLSDFHCVPDARLHQMLGKDY
jgi:hypothetical protein